MVPGFGIHVTVGLQLCVLPVVLAPISNFPGAFEPGDYTHADHDDWGIYHAGIVGPANPPILKVGGAT